MDQFEPKLCHRAPCVVRNLRVCWGGGLHALLAGTKQIRTLKIPKEQCKQIQLKKPINTITILTK